MFLLTGRWNCFGCSNTSLRSSLLYTLVLLPSLPANFHLMKHRVVGSAGCWMLGYVIQVTAGTKEKTGLFLPVLRSFLCVPVAGSLSPHHPLPPSSYPVCTGRGSQASPTPSRQGMLRDFFPQHGGPPAPLVPRGRRGEPHCCPFHKSCIDETGLGPVEVSVPSGSTRGGRAAPTGSGSWRQTGEEIKVGGMTAAVRS